MLIPIQKSKLVDPERSPHGFDDRNSASLRASNPNIEMSFGLLSVGEIPETTQVLLHVVGQGQWTIQGQGLLKPVPFALVGFQVFRILE